MLDLGSGDGRYSRRLKQGGAHCVVGMDQDPEAKEQGQQHPEQVHAPYPPPCIPAPMGQQHPEQA